jgi:hypothetical protein
MILAQTTQALLNSGDYVAMPKWIAYIGGLALGLQTLNPVLMKLWETYFGSWKKVREDVQSLQSRAAAAEQVAVAASNKADTIDQRIAVVSQRAAEATQVASEAKGVATATSQHVADAFSNTVPKDVAQQMLEATPPAKSGPM